jgi:peptide/nickel transport system ATP-binding protein
VLGLIGESGAGKSTIGIGAMAFARAGCRIVGGTVKLTGFPFASSAPKAAAKCAGGALPILPSAASFNPSHRIIDQVMEMPIQHGLMKPDKAREWAIELFKALDLPNPETFGERYPHQVSGGQLQRAMTAMAMSCRPDLLVFDD